MIDCKTKLSTYEGYKHQTPQAKPICTCGANYTSNPNFHLGYCDVK